MAGTAKADAGTRALRIVRDVLLVGGVLAATYPWTSGAYTWLLQRRLAGELTASSVVPAVERDTPATTTASPPRAAASPFASALEGWERQDAAYWRALPEGGAFARLVAKDAGIDITVVKGVSEQDLRHGPGWVTSTAMPGGQGNVGISGHRTTFLAPFRDIDRLEPGDTIQLRSKWRTYTYRMVDRLFVDPNDTEVFGRTSEPMLTLTACHPPYSFQFRIVVRARLVAVTRR